MGQARKRTPTPNASNEIDGVFDREWVGDWVRLMYSLSLKVASSASELPSAHKHTHKLTNTHCWSASSQHSTSSASACVCALPNSESLAIHLIGEAQFLIKLIKLTRWKWREEKRRGERYNEMRWAKLTVCACASASDCKAKAYYH